MIRAEQIPDEVVEAYLVAERKLKPLGECLAAALNAWPGNYHYRGGWEPRVWVRSPSILLPLPQEASDE